MSINTFSDELLSLKDAALKIARVGGKRLHVSTIFRWAIRGVRGQRLETVRVGRTLYTTVACLEKFFTACATAPAERKPREELKPITSRQREKQIQRAEARLAAAGI